jgi:D-xylonolactonase
MATARLVNADLPRTCLGEGPCWDESGRLLWVDIVGQHVHIYDPAKREHFQLETKLPVSFVFPYSTDELIVGLADGVYRLTVGDNRYIPVATLNLPESHRLNDGKFDPSGRLWVGTINTSEEPSETAALYRLEPDGLAEVESGFVNANGKAWSPDCAIMYHADTARGIIWQYDYDNETAGLSNKKVFFNLEGDSPDGLAVDEAGNIFAAIYGGSCVKVFSRRGERVETIDLPVPNVTSCAFGGEDLRTLYITTAYDGMDEAALEAAPFSGHILSIERAIPGIAGPIPLLGSAADFREAVA